MICINKLLAQEEYLFVTKIMIGIVLGWMIYRFSYPLRYNDAKTMTPPPPPCYLRHFQIFDKIVSFPYKFLNVFRIRKANWIFEELSNLYLIVFLTHFMPLISFDTPWKHQKTRGFLMFSGGLKRVQWHEMG